MKTCTRLTLLLVIALSTSFTQIAFAGLAECPAELKASVTNALATNDLTAPEILCDFSSGGLEIATWGVNKEKQKKDRAAIQEFMAQQIPQFVVQIVQLLHRVAEYNHAQLYDEIWNFRDTHNSIELTFLNGMGLQIANAKKITRLVLTDAVHGWEPTLRGIDAENATLQLNLTVARIDAFHSVQPETTSKYLANVDSVQTALYDTLATPDHKITNPHRDAAEAFNNNADNR